MTNRNLLWQLIGVVLTVLLLEGCGVAGVAATPTDTPIPTEPPTAAPTPVPPTPTPPLAVGDSERGREIFETGGGVITDQECSGCHSLDGSVRTDPHRKAPSLQGISERAGDRVPELSAVEYLRQSIVDPSAYVVGDSDDNMLQGYKFFLSEEDIDDLVAFLLTQ